MKRDVEYSEKGDNIFLSMKTGRYFSYRQDSRQLHRLYGGKQYYWSLSGKSGKGYLDPAPNKDDLVQFGTYMPDYPSSRKGRVVLNADDGSGDRLPIWGYAPIRPPEGIAYGHPFVLTDGVRRVMFMSARNLSQSSWPPLSEDNEEDNETDASSSGKWCRFVWHYPLFQAAYNEKFYFRNEGPFYGLNPMWFLRLEEPKRIAEQAVRDALRDGPASKTDQMLHLVRYKGRAFHMSRLGYLDMQIEKDDPRKVVGPVVDGWVGDGNGLFWRRKGLDIQVFVQKADTERFALRTMPAVEFFAADRLGLRLEILKAAQAEEAQAAAMPA